MNTKMLGMLMLGTQVLTLVGLIYGFGQFTALEKRVDRIEIKFEKMFTKVEERLSRIEDRLTAIDFRIKRLEK